MPRIFAVAALLSWTLCCPLSGAAPAVNISLPLEGFYRPGHYIPVRVKAEFDAGQVPGDSYLEIAADAGVPTRLRLGVDGRAAGLVPLLPMERPQRAFWQVRSASGVSAIHSGPVHTSFRQLDPDQRLAGFATGIDIGFARELLDVQSVVPIRLDPADPVSGAAAAWDTLDALVVDAATPGLGEEKLAALLAGGMTIAIRSPQKPDSRWPWVQKGSYWVVSMGVAGPATAADYPHALSAVQGWQADWPRPFRARIFLFAVMFSLLALAATILRFSFRLSSILYPLSILLLAIGTCFALWHWFSSRSPVLERTGAIVIAAKESGLAQRDTWRFYASAREARASVPWHETTIPFFEERAQRRASQIALVCDESGEPLSFDFRLVPALKLALLTRRFEPWSAPPAGAIGGGASSPLAFQLGRAYVNRPLAVRGHFPAAPLDPPGANTEVWPTLIAE